MDKKIILLSAICTLFFNISDLSAFDCPKQPEQSRSEWDTEVSLAVAKIGPAKGADLKLKAKNAVKDLLGKLRNADRVYLEQMMYATYCSALRDDKTINVAEKAKMLKLYNAEVRKAISNPPSPKNDTHLQAKLADVLIDKTTHNTAILDFRVVNELKVDLMINKIKLVPIKTSTNYTKGYVDHSKVYSHVSIDGLDPHYKKPLEIPVAQVVSSGKSDRFGVEVGSTHPNFVGGRWKFKAYLLTSAGEIGGQVLELTLGPD